MVRPFCFSVAVRKHFGGTSSASPKVVTPRCGVRLLGGKRFVASLTEAHSICCSTRVSRVVSGVPPERRCFLLSLNPANF